MIRQEWTPISGPIKTVIPNNAHIDSIELPLGKDIGSSVTSVTKCDRL